jgi:threonine dehydrogenase-like Zn-dependent dehydrogenase
MYGPGDVRVEERDEPRIVESTDAILRVSAACVCGSDLWPYRGIEELAWPAPMGHEYAGIVEEVGDDVETIKPGQFVVGSFWASDTPARSARRAISAPVSSEWAWARRRLSDYGFRWQTGRW